MRYLTIAFFRSPPILFFIKGCIRKIFPLPLTCGHSTLCIHRGRSNYFIGQFPFHILTILLDSQNSLLRHDYTAERLFIAFYLFYGSFSSILLPVELFLTQSYKFPSWPLQTPNIPLAYWFSCENRNVSMEVSMEMI